MIAVARDERGLAVGKEGDAARTAGLVAQIDLAGGASAPCR